jgi:hypothetical protein
MTSTNNYRQEYLDACIYKAHKTDKWADLYTYIRNAGLDISPQTIIEAIRDDINSPIDTEFNTYADVDVTYMSLFDALKTKECHIFMDGDTVFTLADDKFNEFSYKYRKSSNRVSEKIIITEIVPREAPQKLLLFADKESNQHNIENVILKKLGIAKEKIRFVKTNLKLYVYVDIITDSLQQRINLLKMISAENNVNKLLENFECDAASASAQLPLIFKLPELDTFDDMSYYMHTFSNTVALTKPSDFNKIPRNEKSEDYEPSMTYKMLKKFGDEFKSRILIEDSGNKDKMATTMVVNCNNYIVNYGKETNNNIAAAEGNNNEKDKILEKLGIELSKVHKNPKYIRLCDFLKENNFKVGSDQVASDLISRMGFISVNRKYVHKSLSGKKN